MTIVVELVVGGEGKQTAPCRTQREEDLRSSVAPHLKETNRGINCDEIYVKSVSCERYIFSREGHILCHEVFFRMNLPLALEVYNRLFIDSLGFNTVD